MRSAFFVWSVCTAASHSSSASSTCDDADSSSLLQARSRIRVQRTHVADADALLKSMRDVASSFTKGSLVTMTPDDVNTAIGTANSALHTMLPMFEEQHALAQREIDHALAAVQVCHSEHGGEARARHQEAVARHRAAKEQCEETLDDAIEAEHDACEGQGVDPNCLCNEARTAITDQTALCAVITEAYEAVYCEDLVSCHLFQDCFAQELQVYGALASDMHAAMTLRQQQYRTFMQTDCLMNLITAAMLSSTPIDDASLVACDDVSVNHLTLRFPAPPSAPAECRRPQSGDPQCEVGEAPKDTPPPPPPPTYNLVHQGHCASGWISGHNTHQADITACEAHCSANADCGYFAFAEVMQAGQSTNCALYTACGGCDDDSNFEHYNAYQLTERSCENLYSMAHDGHCASGWISGSNTRQANIGACVEQCRSNTQCGYFAFAEENGSNTNCALYTLAGGCADDNNFGQYNAYQMQ